MVCGQAKHGDARKPNGTYVHYGGAIKDMKKTSASDSLIKRASKQQPSMRCKGILDTWNNNVFAAFSVYVWCVVVRLCLMDKNGCVRRFICMDVD